MVGSVDNNASSILNGQSGALLSQNRVADDFQTFLRLLTTQLQNQNPLEPMNTNEFTAQLVQFAGVEQQIAMNTNLESLIGLQAINTQVSALNYIDQEITYVGNEGYLKDGELRFRVAAQKVPESMRITIQDSQGNVVKSYNPAATGEPIDFVWDGKDLNGNRLPDGKFRIRVEASDGNGRPIQVFTAVTGRVTSVRSGPNNEILLAIGNLIVDSANVIAIGQLTENSAPVPPAQVPPDDQTPPVDDPAPSDDGDDPGGDGDDPGDDDIPPA